MGAGAIDALDLDRNIDGGPDLAVEVVSENDTAKDLQKKVHQYLAAGTQAIWGCLSGDSRSARIRGRWNCSASDAGTLLGSAKPTAGLLAPNLRPL